MLRRTLFVFLTVLAVSASRADAVTIRDVIELSKAGLSDSVLLALIEVDRGVFSIDSATLKQLKDGGVSDAVIVAMIRSGRTQPLPEAAPAPVSTTDSDPDSYPTPREREPQVIVIDHHDTPSQVTAPYPVAVPIYVPVQTTGTFNTFRNFNRRETVTTVVPTDMGLVRARVPVPAGCVKAEPVFWGFGGKLRPGSWEPPPTVLCR
ncbi:MAG TPA: hypothetical protein VNC21_04810 [Vicinamibacterales bacterium]|nr:hypothetical protein [Vicinamibacterales bacterium]